LAIFLKRRAFILSVFFFFSRVCVAAFKIRFGRGLCYGTVTKEWTLELAILLF
jgi:hypothetical protein